MNDAFVQPPLTLSESMKKHAMSHVADYVAKDPEHNLPRAFRALEKLDVANVLEAQRRAISPIIDDPENNWNQLIRSLWRDVDGEVLKTMLQNIVVNASLIGYPRQQALAAKMGCNVPWAILMDPTSACNLHCVGCWAADYGNRMNLSFDEMDDIVRQAKAMGTYVFLMTGGEPLVRKRDIIRLCETHPDAMFMAFTNGTLIDEAFADEMLRVKNFMPAISVEGFKDATDFRRGEGTFDAVMRAMDILRTRRLPFGASCCYTSANAKIIGSEEYIDFLVEKGAKFAWFFTYMPIGANAATELIATPEQREFMYRQIRAFRATKPLFTIDFWNDGDYIGGCVAGGREYCHINANGDVEPCAFIHYSDTNIREKTLIEAYTAPLFKTYRANQPFNANMYRPCPLLDNAGKLAEMVDASGAHSTDLESPEDVHVLCGKCAHAAAKWEGVANRLWVERCADGVPPSAADAALIGVGNGVLSDANKGTLPNAAQVA